MVIAFLVGKLILMQSSTKGRCIYLEENILDIGSVSQNGITKTEPIESYVDTLEVNCTFDSLDYSESLVHIENMIQDLNDQTQENTILLRDLVSANSVPELVESVSENTISENSIITTNITEYSLTDSLLLIVIFLLLLGNFVNFFIMKGDR